VVTRVCVCVCLCVFVRGRMPTLSHGTGCNLGVVGMPPSCALLGGFAVGARVALLWQHNANRSYKLAFVSDIGLAVVFVLKSDVKLQPTNQQVASTSQYDNIVRTRNVSECSVLALCLVLIVTVTVPLFIFSVHIVLY